MTKLFAPSACQQYTVCSTQKDRHFADDRCRSPRSQLQCNKCIASLDTNKHVCAEPGNALKNESAPPLPAAKKTIEMTKLSKSNQIINGNKNTPPLEAAKKKVSFPSLPVEPQILNKSTYQQPCQTSCSACSVGVRS